MQHILITSTEQEILAKENLKSNANVCSVIPLHLIFSSHLDSSLSFHFSLHYFCHQVVLLMLGAGSVFLNTDYSFTVWVKGSQHGM